MKIHTCEKCQSIPRYVINQEGATSKWYSCWSHLPRLIAELLDDIRSGVVVRRL